MNRQRKLRKQYPLDAARQRLSSIMRSQFVAYTQVQVKGERKQVVDPLFRVESVLGTYLLIIQKLTIMAWNYNQRMIEWRAPIYLDQQCSWLQENSKILVQSYPKLAVMMFAKVGTAPRLRDSLQQPLIQDILERPEIYFSSTDALCLLLDHLTTQKQINNFRHVRQFSYQ